MVPVLYPCKPPHCRFAPKGLSDIEEAHGLPITAVERAGARRAISLATFSKKRSKRPLRCL